MGYHAYKNKPGGYYRYRNRGGGFTTVPGGGCGCLPVLVMGLTGRVAYRLYHGLELWNFDYLVIASWMFASGLVGMVAGSDPDNPVWGFILGAFGGPLGWLVASYLPWQSIADSFNTPDDDESMLSDTHWRWIITPILFGAAWLVFYMLLG